MAISDQKKTKAQLIKEMTNLRRRLNKTEKDLAEYRLKTKNGEFVYAENKASLLYKDGKPFAIQGIARDITRRKRAEKALQESEERYNAIFNNMKNGVAVYKAVGNGEDFIVLNFNTAAERIAKKTRKQVVGKRLLDAFPYMEKTGLLAALQRVYRSGQPEALPAFYFKDSIWEGWRENFIYKLPTAEVVAVFDDITERKVIEEALQKSEEKYRELVEYANSIILRMDTKGKVTFFNEFAQSFFGYRADEILGSNVVGTIVPPADTFGRNLKEMIHDIGRNPDHYKNNENENMLKSGERVWVAWTNRALVDDNGRLTEILCIGNDITKRKRAEEKLKESEELYRKLVETSPDAIAFSDFSGKLLVTNESAIKLFGYDNLEEVVGKHILEFFYPDDRRQAAENLKILAEEGNRKNREYRFIKKDGTLFNGDINATIFRDSEGKPKGFLGIIRDITEHKRMVEALRESEERHRLHFENVTDVIYSIDSELRVTSMSPSVEASLGYKPSEVIGKRFSELNLLVPEYFEKAFSETLRIFSGETVRNMEYEFIAKDGTRRMAAISSAPLYKDGKVVESISVARDITEQKRIEEALHESEERFRLMAEFSPFPITIVDVDGRYIYANKKFAEVFGYTLADIPTGREWLRLAFPDPIQRKEAISMWISDKEKAAKGDLRKRTFRVRCKDGALREIVFNSRTMDDGKQFITYEDITEAKRARELIGFQRDLSTTLSAISDLDEALRVCLDTAINVSGMDSGGVYLVNDKSGIDMVINRGLGEEFVDAVSHFDADAPHTQFVMAGKMYSNHFSKFPEPISIGLGQENIRSLVVIPLSDSGRIFGCLNIASHTLDEAPIYSLQVLESIAVQIGSAIVRIRTEENIRKLKEQYHLLVENAHDAIVIVQDGIVKYANERTLEMIGAPIENVVSMPIPDFIHPDDKEMVSKIHLNRIQGLETPISYTTRVLTKNNEVLWIEINISETTWENKPAFMATVIDITEHRKFSEMLVKASSEWRNTFDAMTDAVMLINKDFRIVRANKAATESLKLSYGELLGRECFRLIHDTSFPAGICPHALTIFDKREHSAELYEKASGKYFFIMTSPMLDDSGNLTGSVHIMRDVTELKKIQRELQSKEKLATIGEIAGGIAHEIKNPLFAISASIQSLERDINSKKETSNMDLESSKLLFPILYKETERINRLVTSLSLYGKGQTLILDKLNPEELIEFALMANSGPISKKGLIIKKNFLPVLPLIIGDRDKLLQVLENVILNAVEFSPYNATLSVSVTVSDKELVIGIEDEGPGIPEEYIDKIFDLFFSTRRGGTGVGLAISRKIIDMHGGTIKATNRKDGGALFTIKLLVK